MLKALIIGSGRVGSSIALQLHQEGWDVTVVDENEDALSRLDDLHDRAVSQRDLRTIPDGRGRNGFDLVNSIKHGLPSISMRAPTSPGENCTAGEVSS